MNSFLSPFIPITRSIPNSFFSRFNIAPYNFIFLIQFHSLSSSLFPKNFFLKFRFQILYLKFGVYFYDPRLHLFFHSMISANPIFFFLIHWLYLLDRVIFPRQCFLTISMNSINFNNILFLFLINGTFNSIPSDFSCHQSFSDPWHI